MTVIDTDTAGSAVGSADLRLIDTDVHPNMPEGMHTLARYMSKEWVKRLGISDKPSLSTSLGLSNTGEFVPPHNSIYTSLHGSTRLDVVPEDGSVTASTPAMVTEQLLDPWNIDRAVLLPANVFGLGAIPNADIANTIASATNDYIDDVWISADPRYRSGIVACPQDPVGAAKEIRRMAVKRGGVQVLIPAHRKLLGDPHYYPIYEACAEFGLPISVHPSASESIYVNAPQIAGDPPWYYLQWHTTLTLPHQANAVSLVAHGVFERFPTLKVVFTEVGIAWLLDAMWRMDKNWKALRDETPWLKRLPSEYMVDHFRFTTQPFIEPKKREHLLQFIDMIDGGKMMMFSTDFPHWDGDDPHWTLNTLPEDLRHRIGVQNALELYGQRLFD